MFEPKSALAAIIVTLCFMASAFAIDITIDPTTRYQTMVGFGGQAGGISAEQARELVDDMGISVVRVDWCDDLYAAKPLWDAGCRIVVGACWSPPAHMKDNGRVEGGGHLLDDRYDDFADYAMQRLAEFEASYGGEMYALCPQNEPDFAVFYKSCVYEEGEDLIRIASMIGERMQAQGVQTKLNIHDDMFAAFFGKYFKARVRDENAQQYIHALSFHGYSSDGVTPANMSAGYLDRMYQASQRYGYEVWQTENGGSLGMGYATDVIGCLRYGKVSMYLKYGLTGNDVGMVGREDEFYYFRGNKTLTYHVAKTFSKFIRPGAVQLRSTSPDSGTFDSYIAFYDPNASTLTVTIATGDAPRTVTIRAEDLPATFEKWVTNAGTPCENQGNVAPQDIELPANSVVSLFGRDYTPPSSTPVAIPAAAAQRVNALPEKAQYYSVLGRRLSPSNTMRSTPQALGVVVRRGAATRLVVR